MVPDAPHFDADGLSFFLDRIKSCACYLEFGSGGSTVVVAKLGVPFTVVESDRQFLSAVRRKVDSGPNRPGRRFLFSNIGMTTDWGCPLFDDTTPMRIAKWRRYPFAPWPMSPLPDLILIDGRFRVACALVTIKNLYDKLDFEILVDRARFDLLPGQIDRRLVDCEGTELGIEQRIEGEDAQASGSWNPDPSLLGLRDAALFQGAWRTGLGMVRRGAGARLRAQPFLHRVAQRRR